MTIDLYTLISENVVLLLFMVLAIGFLVGKIRIAGIKAGSAIGVLLAGAQDAYASGLGNLRDSGMSIEEAIRNVNVGYALTYLGGTVGVILFVTHFPKLLGINIKDEAEKLARERGLTGKRKMAARAEDAFPIIRAYRVLPETAGKTLRQRAAEFGNSGGALRIRRGDDFLDPSPDFVLEEGDIVSVVAPMASHEAARSKLGDEVLDATLLNYQITTKEIVVLNDSIVGKQFQEQELISEYGCFANGITRSGIDLPISGFITLQRGDRVQVTGEESRLAELAEKVGYVEEEVEETDLLTVSIGVVIGVLVSLVVLKIGNISIGLGTAGGLLIMGILLGYLSSLNPTFGRVPHAAWW